MDKSSTSLPLKRFKLRVLPKTGIKGSPTPRNVARRARYRDDPEVRETQKVKSRNAYRRRTKMDMEGCLHSLSFFEEYARTQRVILPNDKERDWPVLTLPDTALVMQKNHQTLWRWIEAGQLPRSVLVLNNNRRDKVYHKDEVRVFIEEVGKHEQVVTYFRRDHTEVVDRIKQRITSVRKKLGVN